MNAEHVKQLPCIVFALEIPKTVRAMDSVVCAGHTKTSTSMYNGMVITLGITKTIRAMWKLPKKHLYIKY